MSTKFMEILFLSISFYYEFPMGNYATMMQLICGFDAAVIYNPHGEYQLHDHRLFRRIMYRYERYAATFYPVILC